jgi:hypothetical protein
MANGFWKEPDIEHSPFIDDTWLQRVVRSPGRIE